MRASASAHTPLISDFAGDPTMVGIIAEFVGELPDRVESVRQAVQHRDAARVRRIAHQLKGAAGGYGFPTISDSAAEVERLLTVPEGETPDMAPAFDAIRVLLERCSNAAAPRSDQNASQP